MGTKSTRSNQSIAGEIAARVRWANTPDRTAATAAARRGRRAKLEAEIREQHPDLSSDEIEYRVDQLMRAHMLRMSLAAKKARAAKKSTPAPPSKRLGAAS
ncbi:hypothetical protein GCM10027418_19250 [Mariniluteicoccus endophyticus]